MTHRFRTSVWRIKAQIALWRHGWAWPLSLLIGLGATAVYGAVLQPMRETLMATQAELAREQSAIASRSDPIEVASESQQLAALRATLRESPEPAELVRRMAALAQVEQITLPQGEYRHQIHGAPQVVQIHVIHAVRTSYPQLRRYVEAVLRTIPNASLDQIAARRENVGQSQLEVRLHWSLWLPAAAVGYAGDLERTVK